MEVKYNPWNVLSIEAFHFYNCPECDDKYATKGQFVEHAMVNHEKAQATLPTILKNNLVISNVHSIQDNGTEGCDDEEFKLESSMCIVKDEPMTDTELDENCDTSNLQPESDIESDINCDDVLVKISKKEKTQDDLQLKKVWRPKKYKKHKKYKMDPLTKRFRCKQCVKDFSCKQRLIQHSQNVHEGLTFNCDQCSKTYNSSTGLSLHVQTVHEGLTYQCDHCDKDFTQSHHLKRHVRSVHEGVTYQCEQCPKTYKSKVGLYLHMKSIHEGVTYQCEQCHKSFTQKFHLKQHVRLKHTHPKELKNCGIES